MTDNLNAPLHEIVHKHLTEQIKTGRPRHFKDAQQMLDECMEYFRWLDENPLRIDNIASDNGSPIRMDKKRQRAPTVHGLCLFLGISIRKWHDFRHDSDETIRAIQTAVSEMIHDRKFVYGLVNEFNSKLVAMDLGMLNRVSLEGGDSPLRFQQVDPNMDPREAAASYAATMEE